MTDGRSFMKKISLMLTILAIVAIFAVVCQSVSALDRPHWAQKYIDKMVSDKMMPEADKGQWDKDAEPKTVVLTLDTVLGKGSMLDASKTLTRADIIKAAVTNSQWAEDVKLFDDVAWCMSNDELTIPKEYVPYFNLAYRPKYNLLTHKKGRLTAWDKPMTYAELAYLAYHLKYPPNTSSDQQLTIVTTAEPETLNPYTTSSMSTSYIYTFASWGGDVSWGNDATLFPFQLTRVPSIDNGDIKVIQDPVTGRSKEVVVYHIRKGLYNRPMNDSEKEKLHEVTADDYLFNMRIKSCPRIQAVSKSDNWKVESIKKIDRYTFQITWNEVYTYASWGWGDAYKSMLEQDLFTDPQDFNIREDFINMANGPYQMVKWDRGDHIEFGPNPYAIYAQPLIPKITVRFMSDQNTVKLNLESRNVDCAGITPNDYKDLKEKLPDYKIVITDATQWSHIDLNLFDKDPKDPNKPALSWAFGDKRVRQAMLYAIDREEINKVINQGLYAIADSWMSPKSKFFNPDKIKKYEFNPKKAVQLLEEAGWKLTKVGSEMIRCKNGDPKLAFNFKFRTASDTNEAIQMAEQLKNMLGRIGLKINPMPVPGKELLGQSLVRHEWEIVTFSWVSNPIRPSADLFMTKSIPTADNNWAGQNLVGWKGGTEHEKICEEMDKEVPDAKLQDLIDRELEIWCDELPHLPMFNPVAITVCPLNLENYKPTGSNQPTSWNAAYWYREVFK